MTRNTRVLNVRLPENLIGFLDTLVDEGRFSSRSEAIREFSRQYINEQGGKNAR